MVVIALLLLRVEIAWLVLPLAAWAAALILRPNQPDGKRAVLFLVGSGLFLTLMVEVVVLRGDITRMNTVFKFYLQAWTMLSLAAAAGLVWLLPAMSAAVARRLAHRLADHAGGAGVRCSLIPTAGRNGQDP
jgi:uncharacterized membrane protein